jgi:outer membrane protein assembly factor BamD
VIRPFVRYALPFAMLLMVWGCGQKGASLQKSVVPPDKTLFETGEEYLKKSQFIKARLAFQTLISTYPDSDMSADAYFAWGDSFYNEGGTENLLQAEDRYKDFIIFFPTHPKAADAQMKIISINMRQMHEPDRDQQYTVKAAQAIQKFLNTFPDSDYGPIVQQYEKEVNEHLAQSDYGVANFYFEKGNYLGAQSRYKEIVERYGTFSRFDETLYRLAKISEIANNKDEATDYLTKIAQGYPFSRHYEEAKSELQKLGKPVPEINAQLAAANQANLPQHQPFSPLKPFIDFASALGFKGPPDRYEEAKKYAENKKAEAETQAASGAAAGSGDDILIRTEIQKDIKGNTKVQTVLGGNTTGQQAPADKNVDSKADAKKKETDKKETEAKKPPSL